METTKKLVINLVILTFLISGLSGAITYKIIKNSTNNTTIYEDKDNDKNKINIKKEEDKIDLKNLEKNVKNLAKSISPSVVNIIVSKEMGTYRTDPFGFFREQIGTIKKKIGGGTGFFINSSGLIITNKHVVEDENAEYTIVTNDGKEFKSKVITRDTLNDIAIIQAIDNNSKKILNTNSVKFNEKEENIEVGSFVVAIGNALAEFQNTVTFGVISGLGRSIEAGNQTTLSSEQLTGLIQTDTAINPGNSGGPLVGLNGEVYGINTAIAAGANGLGFAIPLTQKEVDYFIKSIEKTGKIQRPFIGIRYFPINKNISKSLGLKSEYGDYVGAGENETGILEGSPAQKAGIEDGDIILEVNGNKLTEGKSVKDFIKNKFPGEKIMLKIMKSDGSIKNSELILGAN